MVDIIGKIRTPMLWSARKASRVFIHRRKTKQPNVVLKDVYSVTFTATWIAGQAAWYRMENRPKAENGKKLANKKKLNGPTARDGPKMVEKQGLGSFSIFSPILGHFFSAFGPFSILYQAAYLQI